MNYIERAIENSIRHILVSKPSDPASLGLLRENAVIAIIGSYGVTSKTVVQRHLELTREGVNKLINRMKKKGLLAVHPSFANIDRSFIILTSQGIRDAELLLNRELHLRSDVSRINERNMLHDLSVQLVVLDLVKANKIKGFASERDIAIQLENRANDPRLIDALVVDANTDCRIAIEMETSNAKNKSNGDLRAKILSKYLQEFEDENGLYEFVYMYSHRQRFLTQIEKAHARLFSNIHSIFTESQQARLNEQIKFQHKECSLLYELMFNSKRQLGDDRSSIVHRDEFLEQLAKMEELAKRSGDRVVELRLDGFRDAGKALGLLE